MDAPDAALPHYVNQAPFDPNAERPMTEAEERLSRASSLRLIWWRFKTHKVALVAAAFLALLYGSLPFVEVLSPYPFTERHADFIYAPPQELHWFQDGHFVGPFVHTYAYHFDLDSFRRVYQVDRTAVRPLRFLCEGAPTRLFGLIPTRLHLVCPPGNGTLFLLGTDRLGRDLLSRLIHGARISLTVGLIGILISFTIGLTLGGLAGYLGGVLDATVLRVIEILRSLPELPLWLALSAALPPNWSPLLIFFGITLILGLLDWPGLALAVRSKVLSLRAEDFVGAAELMGASRRRIVGRHLAPNIASHLIASVTLSIPAMILGETALSFLGLGLRPPVTSWGVLLNEAQNLASVDLYPWLLIPIIPVMLTVLAFNFMGDGLRDAADPYH